MRCLLLLLAGSMGSRAWQTTMLPSPQLHQIYRKRTILASSSLTEPDATSSSSSSSGLEEPPISIPQEKWIDPVLQKQLINGALLIACFGYATYTIFNIDHGMTRGWTQSEIAMRIPLDNWASYESSLLDRPVFTKTLINVIIYLLGDWLSQTLFQKKNVLDFDASRTLKNGLIGLAFGPLVHEYYQFSDLILPVDGGIANRVGKIFMDQTIYLTVKCSVYIAAVSLLSGESWETAQQNVRDRIQEVVFTAWKFWPLVHCLTYSIIPAQHRILWVNSVDLVWNAILASLSNKPEDEETATATIIPDEIDLKNATIVGANATAVVT